MKYHEDLEITVNIRYKQETVVLKTNKNKSVILTYLLKSRINRLRAGVDII